VSFEKFKNIKTTVRIDTDAEYSKKLATLPENKGGGSVMRVILSVAAAFILVAAVGMWMLIGGAIRNQGGNIAGSPDNEADAYPMTEELKTELNFFLYESNALLLPEFDEESPLTVEQVLNYCELTGAAYDDDLILTREEFSEYANTTFGYDMTLSEDKKYEYTATNHPNLPIYEAVSLDLADGIAKIVYQSIDVQARFTLRVICSGTEPLEFGRFVSCKKEENIEVSLEITDKLKSDAMNLWSKFGLEKLADFDKDDPLTVEEIADNINEFEITSDRVITADELSEFAKRRFGYDITTDKEIKLGHMVKNTYVPCPPLTDYRVKDDVITMVYSGGGMSYILTQEKEIITSFKKERTNEYKSVKDAFDEIAKEFRFDIIPGVDYMREADDFSSLAHYIANLMGKTETYTNANGLSVEGIPQKSFSQMALQLFATDSGMDKVYVDFATATEITYGAVNGYGNDAFISIKELTPMGKVKYKSSKTEDVYGYKQVSVTYVTDKGECTVVYRSLDGIVPFAFESCERKEDVNGKEKTQEQMMADIAREYNFDAIHAFEEGTTPDYMRYHIATLYNELVSFRNGKGAWFYGMPLDDYKELAIKYYGKNDMEGKTPIDFEEQVGYLKYADLVKTDAGVYVCIESADGYIADYTFTDIQYGETKSGENCITATFYLNYVGVAQTTQTVKTVCFTTEGEMTPKQFISCTVATSEPIK